MNDENNPTGQPSQLTDCIETICNTVMRLNENLECTTGIVDTLNARLSHLAGIQIAIPNARFIPAYDNSHLPPAEITSVEKAFPGNRIPSNGKHETGKNEFLETIDSVHKLAEGSKKVTEVFEELSPKVKTVKNVLGSIGDLTEGVSGISKLLSAAEGDITAAEGISTAAEIMTGAAGIAEIGAALGPAGWVVGISALAIGGVAAAVISDPKDDKAGYINTDALKQRKIFEEQESRNDFEKLQVAENVKTSYEREEARKETYAGYMVAAREKRIDIMMLEWQKNIDDIRKRTSVDISPLKEKHVHWTQEQNRTFIDDFFLHSSSNLANDLAREDEIKKVNQKYDLAIAHLPSNKNTEKEKERLSQWKQNETDTLWEKYASGHLFLPLGRSQNIRLATPEDMENARRMELGIPLKPTGETPKGKSMTHTRHDAATAYSVPSSQNGKVININLNKPMIEHFTINAKEVREGITDFKHKVEEVLLEILNSANAIH